MRDDETVTIFREPQLRRAGLILGIEQGAERGDLIGWQSSIDFDKDSMKRVWDGFAEVSEPSFFVLPLRDRALCH